MSKRATALAERLLEGARSLADLSEGLSEGEWQAIVPNEERPVSVLVHHVAVSYPVEVELAQTLAAGRPIVGVTPEDIDHINAEHSEVNAGVDKQDTLDLLRRNSQEAASAVRRFSNEELDRAAPVSLNADAPLTAQFFIEDHALRHSFQHLASIRAALGR